MRLIFSIVSLCFASTLLFDCITIKFGVLANEIQDKFSFTNDVHLLPVRNKRQTTNYNPDTDWIDHTRRLKENVTYEFESLRNESNAFEEDVSIKFNNRTAYYNESLRNTVCEFFKGYKSRITGKPPRLFFKHVNANSKKDDENDDEPNIIILHNVKIYCEDDGKVTCSNGTDASGNNWDICEGRNVSRTCLKPKTSDSSLPCEGNSNHRCNCKFLVQEISPLQKEADYNQKDAEKTLSELIIMVNSGQTTSQNKNSSTSFKGKEIEEISDIAASIPWSRGRNSSLEQIKNLTETSIDIITKLIVTQDKWEQLTTSEKPRVITSVINDLESMSLAVNRAKSNENFNGTEKDTKMDYNGIFVAIGSKSIEKEEDTNLFFSDNKTNRESFISVTIPTHIAENISRNTNNSQTFGFLGAAIPSEFVENQLKGNISAINETGTRLNSKVITFNVSGIPSWKLKGVNVTIKFENKDVAIGKMNFTFRRRIHKDKGERKAIFGKSNCSFWNTKELKWSTEGCLSFASNLTSTTCVCNHLTTFAVLAGYYGYEDKDWILQLLTWILCPISLLCLSITLIIFACLLQVNKDQRIMTIHLTGTLICGNLLLLITDKDHFYFSTTVCISFGMASHYVWLCAFGWMACQGIQLYAKVILVFNTSFELQKFYALGSYGIPLLIVGLTVAVGCSVETLQSVYVGEMFCWLQGNYRWFFMGPVLIILIGNLIILVLTIYKVKARAKDQFVKKATAEQKSNTLKLIRATVTLSMLLGLTWCVGFFSLINFTASIYLAHAFTILNASQGIFIFIFHCCMNEAIRPQMKKFYTDCVSSASRLTGTTTTSTTNATTSTNTTTNASVNDSSATNSSISEMRDLSENSIIRTGSVKKRKPFFKTSSSKKNDSRVENEVVGAYKTFYSGNDPPEVESRFEDRVMRNEVRDDSETGPEKNAGIGVSNPPRALREPHGARQRQYIPEKTLEKSPSRRPEGEPGSAPFWDAETEFSGPSETESLVNETSEMYTEEDETQDISYGFGNNVSTNETTNVSDGPGGSKARKSCSGLSVGQLKKRLFVTRMSMKKGNKEKGTLADDFTVQMK